MVEVAPDDPLLLASRVVVIDACSALDVIRTPVRDKWVADAASIEAMLVMAGAPPD